MIAVLINKKRQFKNRPIVYNKDIRIIEDTPYYESFGHPQRVAPDIVRYTYRRGTTHILNGELFGRDYNIYSDVHSSGFLVYEDPGGLDMRDCWGGVMDNGESVIFSASSHYTGTGSDLKSHAIIMKANISDMVYGAPRSLFNGTLPEMQRGEVYGLMQKGSAPGEYYHAVIQFNSDAGTVDRPQFPLYRLDVIRTTDYWETWTTQNVFEGDTLAMSENPLAVFPDGRMTMLARRDPGGYLYCFECAGWGQPWVGRFLAQKLGYGSAKVRIPIIYVNRRGLMDVMWQDRNTGWIAISRNNNPDDYFGGVDFNFPELFYYNRFGGLLAADNFTLGYTSLMEIEDNKYLVFLAQQQSTSKAVLFYTLVDFDVDPAGLPAAPIALQTFALTATTVLVYCTQYDEGGWTRKQTENIKWVEICVSTVSDFSSFATIGFIGTSSANEVDHSYIALAENVRYGTTSQVNLHTLTPNTTYYVRMRSVNNTGVSAWTTISFTTLAS